MSLSSWSQCTEGSKDLELIWKVVNRTNYYPPNLHQPYDVTFDDTNIIVAEGFWPYSRLQVFSAAGCSVRTLGQGKILPFGVTTDTCNNIVITDHHDRTVKIFTSDGEELTSWKPASFEWPSGIAVDQCDRYYICDWAVGKVSVHEQSGKRIRDFRTISAGSSFSCPAYIALDRRQRIIVTDTFDRSVKIYDSSGHLILRIEGGRSGIVDPRGVCTDKNSNIIVADWGDNSIKCFSPDGQWIKDVLTKEHGIQYPRGVALSSSDLLAVTEQKLNASPSLKLFS